MEAANIYMVVRKNLIHGKEWPDPTSASAILETSLERMRHIDKCNPEFTDANPVVRLGKFLVIEINNPPETSDIKFPQPGNTAEG